MAHASRFDSDTYQRAGKERALDHWLECCQRRSTKKKLQRKRIACRHRQVCFRTASARNLSTSHEVIGRADYLPEFSNTSHPGMGQFAFVATPFFQPDPRKKYYIDSPAHDLRIGADGKKEAPFTVPTATTGEQVEWIFVANGKGAWHIQLAAGGSKSRLRSRSSANGKAAMRSVSSKGALTYYRFSAGDLSGTSFVTLPDAKKITSACKSMRKETSGLLRIQAREIGSHLNSPKSQALSSVLGPIVCAKTDWETPSPSRSWVGGF